MLVHNLCPDYRQESVASLATLDALDLPTSTGFSKTLTSLAYLRMKAAEMWASVPSLRAVSVNVLLHYCVCSDVQLA